MRRRWTLVVVLVVMAMTAAACGGDSETPADGGEQGGGGLTGAIEVWIMDPGTDENRAIFTDYAAGFEAENEDTTVDIQFVPWADAHDKFVTAVGGGSTPDVAEMGTTWTPEFAELGGLAPLEGGGDDYIESLIESGSVDGTPYGMPWYAGTRALVYRADVLDDLGLEVPDTWDDVVAAGEVIEQETDLFPFGVAGDYLHMLAPMVWQAGGQIATENGGSWDVQIDSPEAVEAFEFYADIYRRGWSPKGALSWNELDLRGAFENGDVAMMVAGVWDVPQIHTNAPDLEGKLGTALLPAGPGGSRDTFAGGSHLVVFEESENKDTARAFAEYMLEPGQVSAWTDATGFFAGTVTAIDQSDAIGDPLYEPFALQLRDHSRTYPPTPAWGAVEGEKVFTNAIQRVMKGEISAEEAVSEVAAELDAALNE